MANPRDFRTHTDGPNPQETVSGRCRLSWPQDRFDLRYILCLFVCSFGGKYLTKRMVRTSQINHVGPMKLFVAFIC